MFGFKPTIEFIVKNQPIRKGKYVKHRLKNRKRNKIMLPEKLEVEKV